MENILVTGANAGLGRALVEAFLESGRRVFAGVHRNRDGLAALRQAYEGRIEVLTMDVGDEEAVRVAVAELAAKVDSLDVIVNNAGILYRDTATRPIEELNLERMAMTMNVNTYGPLRVLKHAMPLLYRGSRRLVVNISSEAGSITECFRKDWYDYCMSKAALNMSSMILQNYLKERDVKVLAVHPGWVSTTLGGSEAPITPETSAAGILNLVERKWTVDDPIFMDFEGKLWNW